MFHGIIIETVDNTLFFIVDSVSINQQNMTPDNVIKSMLKHYLDGSEYYEVTELSWIGEWRTLYPGYSKTPIKYQTHRFRGIQELSYLDK